MYGLTRGTITLLGAAGAGVLVWLATQIDDGSNGGYWAVYGLIAAAGLVMAFSQILGGWTKWGWPRLSLNVFLLAFLPVLVTAGWVVVAHQPDSNWFRAHVLNWSDDIGILGLVRDLTEYVAVLAFGIGLVFGFTFDTSGPAVYGPFGRRRRAAAVPAGGAAPPPDAEADRPTAREEAEAAREDEAAREREPARTE
ncbi:MAG TPA: hypothetical protein VGP56_11630 [Gaiellaceae bacterium]|jgi:hypothetical protein|nr:hypothetical protein [Gaiellaceae bacterium]